MNFPASKLKDKALKVALRLDSFPTSTFGDLRMWRSSVRKYSSFHEARYLPRHRSSFHESASACYYNQTEVDPRDYGYRVVVPSPNNVQRRFSTITTTKTKETIPETVSNMEESSSSSSSHRLVFERAAQQQQQHTPIDEYSFIMSSHEPVSSEECLRKQKQESNTLADGASSFPGFGADEVDLALDA